MENNLPKGWIECKLGDILKIQNGFAFPSKDFRKEKGVPLIKQSQLSGDKVNLTNCVYLDESYLKTKREFILKKGDVLIGMSGSIGKLCTYDLVAPALQNQRTGKVVLKSETEIDKRFIWYFLSTIEKQLLEKGKGLGVANVSADDIESLYFPLAPLPEQQRIVEKLDALMARISNSKTRLDKIPAVLKNFRQSVLAAAASGELTKEWREENDVESADNLLMRFEDYRRTVYNEALKNAKKSNSSKPTLPRALKEDFYFEITETDELPNSWQWTVIDKIGVVALGGTPSRKIAEYWKGDINWVSSGEVSNNRISDTIEKITQEGLENSNAKIYPKGTVLLAMIGEGKTRGQSSILDAPSSTNQNVAAIILNNDFFHSEYVWYYLQSIYERIRKDGSGGAQQALNGFLVGQLNIAIPPLEEQKEIVRKVEELFHFANSIEARYQKAKAWFDKLPQAILAKAFRGELVSQNENDEPASELLKRIQNEKHSITKTPKPAALKTKAKKYRMDEDEGLSMVAEG